MNSVVLMGRVTKDIELRKVGNDISACSFTVAVNRPKYKDKEQEVDFINCQAWRQSAEFISRYFYKGSMIAIEGKLQVRKWEKDGKTQYASDVVVEQVHFCGGKKDSSAVASDAPSGFTTVETDDDLPF
jgi:single-strand DNA-binding protein